MKGRAKTVLIEIHGGVAHVKRKPKDVRIVVRDYDTDNVDEAAIKTDRCGCRCTETVKP